MFYSSTARAKETSVRTVEAMRQLSAQLAEAERKAIDAARMARLADGTGVGSISPSHNGMLTDTYGRHHNYLRISLTERYGFGSDKLFFDGGVSCVPCQLHVHAHITGDARDG